jgi:hypothetical protein
LISSDFPKPRALLECEINTLQFLRNTTRVQSEYQQLYVDAELYYNAIYQRKKSALSFDFESELSINTVRGAGIAHIGAHITINEVQDYENLSYYIALLIKSSGKDRLIRKYHFDHTLPGTNDRQPHPVFHLQYAGEMSPGLLKKENLDYEHMDAWLKVPRLYYMPMSLALLINLVLIEFPSDKSRKIFELPEWRNLVRSNENLIIKPFYKNCHNFISTRDKTKLFINDFYYGN